VKLIVISESNSMVSLVSVSDPETIPATETRRASGKESPTNEVPLSETATSCDSAGNVF
jgi:hypothetical protein